MHWFFFQGGEYTHSQLLHRLRENTWKVSNKMSGILSACKTKYQSLGGKDSQVSRATRLVVQVSWQLTVRFADELRSSTWGGRLTAERKCSWFAAKWLITCDAAQSVAALTSHAPDPRANCVMTHVCLPVQKQQIPDFNLGSRFLQVIRTCPANQTRLNWLYRQCGEGRQHCWVF